VLLSRFKTSLRKEDAGVFKALVKQTLATKKEEEIRAKVEVEAVAKAAADADKAAADAAEAKARGGLLGLGGRFL